jgi:hypothetical protein
VLILHVANPAQEGIVRYVVIIQAVKQAKFVQLQPALQEVVRWHRALPQQIAIILEHVFQDVLIQAAVIIVSNQIAALARCTPNAKTPGTVPNLLKMEEYRMCAPSHVQHVRRNVITSPVTDLTAHSLYVIQLVQRMIVPTAHSIIVQCAIVLALHVSILAAMLNNTPRTRSLYPNQDQLLALLDKQTNSVKLSAVLVHSVSKLTV